jgi:lysophospholipase L1-like esterase
MTRKILFAARMFGWLLIVLVSLELCARTEDKVRYGAPFLGNYSLDALYGRDKLGKYGLPNSGYLKWHLNEAGYRGPALRKGTYRIVCIGSSETFGLYESAEKEWPRQLESKLNKQGNNEFFEVVDIAYPGMSVGTSLSRLPRVLDTLHPQMAVIYASYTPYIDIWTAQKWPLAHVIEGPLVADRHFHLRILGKAKTVIKADIPEGLQDWLRALQARRGERRSKVMERLPDANVEAFQTDLDRLTRELQRNNVRAVLVTHANRFGGTVRPEDAAMLMNWHKFFPTLRQEGLLDMEARMSTVVRRVGAARGVPVVDAASQIAPGKENFEEFVHFTDAGSAALSSLVSTEIEREEPSILASTKPAR